MALDGTHGLRLLDELAAAVRRSIELMEQGQGGDAQPLLREVLARYEQALDGGRDPDPGSGPAGSGGAEDAGGGSADVVQMRDGSRRGADRPKFGWESLTPTERLVVELVTEGLTTPQIAERLYVSRDTVKTHIGHVYCKLGISSRVELATAAVRRLQSSATGGFRLAV